MLPSMKGECRTCGGPLYNGRCLNARTLHPKGGSGAVAARQAASAALLERPDVAAALKKIRGTRSW